MTPDVQFRLDRGGFDECISLLAAAGLEFIELRREHFAPMSFEDIPAFDRIFGTLRSPYGVHECFLLSSGQRYEFSVTIESDTTILDDLTKAFAGHLLDERKSTNA